MAKVKPTESAKSSWGTFFRFIKQIKLDWVLILVSLVVSIGYYEVVTRIPEATAKLLSGDFSTAAIVGCVGIYLAQLGIKVVVSMTDILATARSTRSARKVIWSRMMGVKTEFYLDNTPEKLLSAVTSDTETAVSYIIYLASGVIPSMYYMFRSFDIISGYNMKLLMTLLVMIPVNILYAYFMGKWQYKTNFRIQSRIGGLTGYLAERLKNLGLIKSFANEKAEDANGQRTIKELYNAKKHSIYIDSAAKGYTFGTEVISIVSAVLLASVLMREGELTLEGWMTFYLFMPGIGSVLREICSSWVMIKGLQGSSERLGKIIGAPQEKLEQGKPVSLGDITFENVSFSYGDDDVLKNVSFTAPAGKVTAVVGLSGSGKSTMFNLLERLYMPDEGRIAMNGEDVFEMDLAAYRKRFAYVPQDAGVFSGSYREVLTYGVDGDVTDEELKHVTEMVGMYEFIASQDEGFNSSVSLWGNSLSGGQRQRLVIARELLKNADVLLFDEPTSSLDPSTAREIQKIILDVFKGKTVLMISHDLSLVGAAGNIVVIDQGSIVSTGTHDVLTRTCQLYKELVDEQAYREVYA